MCNQTRDVVLNREPLYLTDLNARHPHVREEQGEETGVGLQLQPAVSEVVQILLLTRHLVPSLGQSHHRVSRQFLEFLTG